MRYWPGTRQRQPGMVAVVHAAAYDVTFRHTGNMRLLDPDAPDADAPDAYYLYPAVADPSIGGPQLT